jgi:tRNA(Ile)-lysidine synthetase-like protein
MPPFGIIVNRFETTWLGQIQSRGDGIREKRVLVACSGGGDSVALLCFLWAVRKSLDLDLVVAHADHGLRMEATEDALFVQQLCRYLDLDLVEARFDVEFHAKREGIGLEMAARDLRWAWLRAEAASCGASVVATGHTLDDHTETVFLRLARGGGIGSLTPLPVRQELRWSPLIEIRRSDLRAYLQQKRIPWREDASNEDAFTARNRWRKLLVALREEAPTLDANLWETHLQVSELQRFRDSYMASLEGRRWNISDGALWMEKGTWDADELRWLLDAAFRRLGWNREADQLRNLTAWLLPLLDRKSAKKKIWGGWQLNSAPNGWKLHPITGATLEVGTESLEAP